MLDRSITCRNEQGYEITFAERGLNPFILNSVTGIYEVENEIYKSDNVITDGSTYQGSVRKERNIVITVTDNEDFTGHRNMLDSVFVNKGKGELKYSDGVNKRKCTYYVEKMDSSGTWNKREHSISLICTDPFFYDMNDIEVYLAEWESFFEFPHNFFSSKEVFGKRSTARSRNIINENADNGIGIEVRITAIGDVKNPSISHLESGDVIRVGTNENSFEMEYGDILVITTDTGNKKINVIRDGKSENVNRFLSVESEFIQLQRGSNHIGYGADDGADNLAISIIYKMRYLRV